MSPVSPCTTKKGYGAHRLKGFDTRPYMTSKGRMVMRGNIGTCRSKDFDVWPIVTCDDGIITAWVCGLKGFDTRLIVI